jgi:hypothetical protein
LRNLHHFGGESHDHHPSPIHFSTKDTLRVSCRSLSFLEVGEGALQKTGILQFFYRTGKVYTRCVEHFSIPHTQLVTLRQKSRTWRKENQGRDNRCNSVYY